MLAASMVIVGGIIMLSDDGYQTIDIINAVFTWALGIAVVFWILHAIASDGWFAHYVWPGSM